MTKSHSSIISMSHNYVPLNDITSLGDGDVQASHKIRRKPIATEQELKPTSTLRKSWADFLTTFLVDILIALAPVPFLVLAIALAKVNGLPVAGNDLNLLRTCTTLAGTLFPIVFAAVVGRATVKAAAWQLERGAALIHLEQLLGSKTIFGTITTQWMLRSFNVLGISLVLLWILSPFGGQSSLRILSTTFDAERSTTSIGYFDSGTQSGLALRLAVSPNSDTQINAWFLQLHALYTSVLLSPPSIKSSNVDLWGNIKVPLMSSYVNQNASGWTTTPQSGNVVFSSLVGIPLTSTANKNMTFTIESTYIELDCANKSTGPIQHLNSSAFLKQYVMVNPYDKSSALQYYSTKNGTLEGNDALPTGNASVTSATWSLALDTFVDTRFNASTASADYYNKPWAYPGYFINNTNIKADQGTLQLQNLDVSSSNFVSNPKNSTSVYCKLSQVYVESNVSCRVSSGASQDCAVISQRPSLKSHAPSAITHLSWPEVFRHVSNQLPRAIGIGPSGGRSDYAMYYLENVTTSFMTNNQKSANLQNVSLTDINIRLGQIINAYLMITQAGFQITGDGTIPNNLTTTASISRDIEIYCISRPWLVVYTVATLSMLSVGIISVILSYMTLNPDILGTVSSIIRDSRYVQLPVGNSVLSGLEIARINRDIRLRMGTIQMDHDDRSHLGIAAQPRVTRSTATERYL